MLNIFWFRKDLRIEDNNGLCEFIKRVSDEKYFSFLYIKNKNSFRYFGEKRISFLIECLKDLQTGLNSFGFKLQIIEGNSCENFQWIVNKNRAINVFCNRQVEPYCISRDNVVKCIVEKSGGSFNTFKDSTIFDPDEIKNGNGGQYKVHTPFKNQALSIIDESYYKKAKINLHKLSKSREVILSGNEKYNIDNEYKTLLKSEILKGGRTEGIRLLKEFYWEGVNEYYDRRDYPSAKGTSLLSAHIHFGTVGIRECFRTAFVKLKKTANENKRIGIQTWMNELLWREFYYYITFHNPRIAYESFRKEYDEIKWDFDEKMFMKWCKGKTGLPIIDAGMRQLNQEGWMHNRIRMITAMFLTKDLMIDWRHGEKYFAEKLIDLDFSNNNGGWQWSASAGVDAQPYFRIFNPYLQSKRFDAEGTYIKKFVPELKSLPVKFIHEPNLMSAKEQETYGVKLGKDYPAPVIEHRIAKEKVIKQFRAVFNRKGFKY